MATNQKSQREYEKEIKKLKKQVQSLERSKIELMLNTNKEIDRLREYVKFLTHKKHAKPMNEFTFSTDYENGSLIPSELDYNEEEEDEDESDDHQNNDDNNHLDEHTQNRQQNHHENHFINNDSNAVHQQSTQNHAISPPSHPVQPHTVQTLNNNNNDAAMMTTMNGDGDPMDVKPMMSYLHRKRKTDTGQLNEFQTELLQSKSVVVDAEDMKQSVDMHQDLIEEMEYILNEFMSLQLFGVVECKCVEPKQLQFFANVHSEDTPNNRHNNMQCDNCHQSYVSIFKCDSCGMAICSQCQTFIAEMQCLRAVMQHFMYAKDYRLKQQREQQQKMHQKKSDTMYTMPLFDTYADDDMYGFGMD